MSTPDYPLLTVPGYELYQLAHLTSFAVDALAPHRRAMEAKDRLIHRAPAAGTTSANAADAGPTPTTRFPGGFPAAAAALPSPGARPPQESDDRILWRRDMLLGTVPRARSLGLGVVGVGTAVMSPLVLHRWVDDVEAGYCSAVSESPGTGEQPDQLGGLSTVRPDPGR